MKRLMLFCAACSLSAVVFGQDLTATLPYYKIPEYPAVYNAGTVAARMIDGLGFRFYWATEGLRNEDLVYRPSEGARNLEETVDHIYGLVAIIQKTAEGEPYTVVSVDELSFEEKRRQILENLMAASTLLKQKGSIGISDKMVFKRGEQTQEYPFWNLLNGPIADAINHTGQVITFRRSAGNPINPKISVLTGSVFD